MNVKYSQMADRIMYHNQNTDYFIVKTIYVLRKQYKWFHLVNGCISKLTET